MSGGSAIDWASHDFANVLVGNVAANTESACGGNDTLDGGAGADTLYGGLRAESYHVDSTGDVVNALIDDISAGNVDMPREYVMHICSPETRIGRVFHGTVGSQEYFVIGSSGT